MKTYRDILAPNAIEKPQGDLGAESCKSPNPTSHGALGSEKAHGDLANWDCSKYERIDQGGAAGITVGGETGRNTTI
jgi:hypothetical protein